MKTKIYDPGLSRNGRHKILYFLLVGVLISMGLWMWGYFSLLRSNDYAFAQQYLASNSIVKDVFGEIASIRPGYVNFKRSLSSGSWNSSFQIVVIGNKSSGVVSRKMKSTSNGWQIEDAVLKSKGDKEVKL